MSEARSEARDALNLYNYLIALIEEYSQNGDDQFELTVGQIIQIHSIAMASRGTDQAGRLRQSPVRVAGAEHTPPPVSEIEEHLVGFCDYINSAWSQKDAIHLAAYALWKLNWIHPFIDGNGRTARALSYLLLSAKLGFVLPGIPTISEQLVTQRNSYYDALQASDTIFRKTGKVDTGSLEKLLKSMLFRQLSNTPSISEDDQAWLNNLTEQRLSRAPKSFLIKRFGSVDLVTRLWSVSDYLILQIGPEQSIEMAEEMQSRTGTAFPSLIAEEKNVPKAIVGRDQKGMLIREGEFVVGDSCPIEIERDSAAIIEAPRVRWLDEDGDHSWELQGALYAYRLGHELSPESAEEVFDFLLARHLSVRG